MAVGVQLWLERELEHAHMAVEHRFGHLQHARVREQRCQLRTAHDRMLLLRSRYGCVYN